ncbi:MAG: sugar transferase [Hyphomonadaceae bacterium]|nr:sugar transferase [Hyphomonadaceae bacterium]
MSLQNEFPVLFEDGTLEELSGLELVDIDLNVQHESRLKRIFDITLAFILSLILAPLLLVICASIKLADGGPAIFKQKRIGRNGEVFRCWKFRTMIVNSDEVLNKVLAEDPRAAAEWDEDHKLRNDPRVTAMGCFLRKTSLDELPQLWNILKGEMSLVGPRPIVESEVKKYGRFFRAYISVSPGVTGLWQVSGRNDTGYAERVRMDVEYVNNYSIWTDLKIIMMTVPAVLSTRGAY